MTLTVYLSSDDVRSLCNEPTAMVAAKATLAAQRDGDFMLPSRFDIDTSNGFFRVMPGAVGGYAGMKVMTLARGVGNRYLMALYSQATGELIALLDADEITRLRTAATTALAGELLCGGGIQNLGLIGTGFEATGHLRAFANLWDLESVHVYSTSKSRREAFAKQMSLDLGVNVVPVSSAREAVGYSGVSLLCTKSTSPVVNGADFPVDAVVLSIGSTRPDLRELDAATFRRSAAVLVDDPKQVLAESGDVINALDAGAISLNRIVPMHEWGSGSPRTGSDRDLLTYKSVGTALQDLTLSATLVEAAKEQGIGRELGELAGLKPAARTAV